MSATCPLVAIVNLSPDSFSGDGICGVAQAPAYARAQLEAGAQVLDVGAESTRPGATPISADEEWRRLAPAISELAALCKKYGASLSIDTRHAATAARALDAGADWINDVQGLSAPDMLEVLCASSCRCVLMHSLSVPADPALHLPQGCNVVQVVQDWFSQRIEQLQRAGIDASRLILDPGLGFGKTAAQSLTLLHHAHRFRSFGVPVLVGHSRKSFLTLFSDDPAMRDALTLAFSSQLYHHHIDYLRVHDVAAHARLFDAIKGDCTPHAS